MSHHTKSILIASVLCLTLSAASASAQSDGDSTKASTQAETGNATVSDTTRTGISGKEQLDRLDSNRQADVATSAESVSRAPASNAAVPTPGQQTSNQVVAWIGLIFLAVLLGLIAYKFSHRANLAAQTQSRTP